MRSAEDYADVHGKMHPALDSAMAGFFDYLWWHPARAKMEIIEKPIFGQSVFVLGRTIYFKRGLLGRGVWDFSTVEGFSMLAHEVYHAYQYDSDPLWTLAGYFSGIMHHVSGAVGRWIRPKLGLPPAVPRVTWHTAQYEQDAIAFAQGVAEKIDNDPHPNWLAELKELR